MFFRWPFRNTSPKAADNELSVLFDERYYLSCYPEVATGTLSPLDHFLKIGAMAGRDPNPLFCTHYYLARCPELLQSGENPLLHFIREGFTSGVNPSPLFDMGWFTANHKKPLEPNGNPLVHYLKDAANCGCDPNPLFQTEFYLERHPEVRREKINPVIHYFTSGADSDFDPSPEFNTAFYKRNSPDVVRLGINPLQHYFCAGKNEGRLPRNLVLDSISNALSDCYEQLRELEALLPALEEVAVLQVRVPSRVKQAGRAYLKLAELLDKPFNRLIIVGQSSSHLAPTLNVVPDLCLRYGAKNLLMIAEDASVLHEQGGLLPHDLRTISLADITDGLTLTDQVFILLRLIVQVKPEAVHNVGSIACAVLFQHYASQLKQCTRLAGDAEQSAIQESKRIALSTCSSGKQAGQTSQVIDEKVDISVVTICCKDRPASTSSMRSIAKAIEHARNKAGLSVEWLLILGGLDESTKLPVEENAPSYARFIETGTKDPGLARDVGVLSSRGQWIALADSDELLSINWLAAAHHFLMSSHQKRVIAHPMAEIWFGAESFLRTAFDSDEADFTRMGLVCDRYWVSGFGAKETFLEFPFGESDTEHGFAFEDITFNCNTIAANIVHKRVPDTFICCRATTNMRVSDFTLLSSGAIPGSNNLLSVAFQRPVLPTLSQNDSH